jgi:hypothetical protein
MNDLLVRERLAALEHRRLLSRPAGTRYRYFLGVKWSCNRAEQRRATFLELAT